MDQTKRNPTPRLNFTIRTIEALPPAPADSKSGRVEYMDTDAPGLYLRVSKNGVKTFSYFGRAKGARKAERFTIGRFPVVKPEQARHAAWKLAGEQAKGESITRAARDKRGEMTLDTLKEKYAADLQKRNAKDVEAFEKQYARHIQPYFGKLRLSDIKADKVAEWHQRLPDIIMRKQQDLAAARAAIREQRRLEIEERHAKKGRRHGPQPKPKVATQRSTSTVVVTGKGSANRALESLRAMFNWAGKPVRGYFTGTNPATGHTKYPNHERERFLRPGEASAFFQALLEEQNITARDCIMMKLLTGGRRANVHAMRWDQIDFREEVWHIPGAFTKNGTPQYVPLVPEALALLKQRYDARTSNVWVFPADRSDSKHGHIGNLKAAWHRVMVRSGLSNLRQHDLRRTLGSWQARHGATLLLIGKSLNHKHPASTAIYARLDIEPVRASIEQATTAIFEAAGVKPTAQVIDLKDAVGKRDKRKQTAHK